MKKAISLGTKGRSLGKKSLCLASRSRHLSSPPLFTRRTQEGPAENVGAAVVVVQPQLLIPVRAPIPANSGPKSTEALSSVCPGGMRRSEALVLDVVKPDALR